MGYYEAVISQDSEGKKRMYGWRYLGFSPYSPCPQESCGVECQTCQSSELFGLVFVDGVMTFRPLAAAQFADTEKWIPDPTGIERAIQKLESEVSKTVPVILEAQGITGVSNKDVDVTVDQNLDVVIVVAKLNDEQWAAYKKSPATNFEIAEQIAQATQQQLGETIRFEFTARAHSG
jgi:hypothetical protein